MGRQCNPLSFSFSTLFWSSTRKFTCACSQSSLSSSGALPYPRSLIGAAGARRPTSLQSYTVMPHCKKPSIIFYLSRSLSPWIRSLWPQAWRRRNVAAKDQVEVVPRSQACGNALFRAALHMHLGATILGRRALGGRLSLDGYCHVMRIRMTLTVPQFLTLCALRGRLSLDQLVIAMPWITLIHDTVSNLSDGKAPLGDWLPTDILGNACSGFIFFGYHIPIRVGRSW